MATFTITPAFDVAGGLPSDLDVYYSTDQTTWVASNGANYTYVTPDLTAETTYYAQIRSSASTPISDENGTELPIRSVTVNSPSAALSPGSETPSTWAAFTVGADGDGLGLDTSADTSDTLIGDAPPAARFLTPMYNDNDDITEIALAVHPTSYYKSDGTAQADPTVYIYCNGNRVAAAKKTSGYGDQEIWYAPVENATGLCEYRAIIVPEKGTPAILQGGWVWDGARYALDMSSRGCVSNDYTSVQVGPGQTFTTLAAAFAAQTAGDGAVRYVCSGQGTAWADAFSTTDVMCAELAADINTNPLYEAWPIVEGAKLKMAYDSSTATRGVIWDNCEIYNWPNPATTYSNRLDAGHEEYWYRNNSSSTQWRCNNHDMFLGTVNCTVAIKENTTYTRPGGNATAAQVHVDRGFGTLMQLYDLGKGGNQVGFNHSNVSAMTLGLSHHGTSFRFMGSNCEEAVNVTSVCPSADNDIFNSSLVVNTYAHSANKYVYPFGSSMSDQTGIGYNFDYSQTTSDSTNTWQVVSDGVIDMQNFVDFDGSTTVPNNPPPYATKDTVDAGIWPDMLFSKWREGGTSPADDVDLTVIFEQADGSYEDYYGYTYATWPFLWDNAQDPHLDFVQGFAKDPDYILIGHSGLLGWHDNQDYQGIFYRSSTVTEAGAWYDLEFTSGPQVKYSVGMENATAPGAMLFGPNFDTPGGTTSLRDYVTASNIEVQLINQNIGSDPYTDLGITDTGYAVVTGTTNSGGTANIVVPGRPTPPPPSREWETLEDGVWGVPSATNTPTGEIILASTAYNSTSSSTFQGWYRAANNPASRYWDTSAGDVPPPYVAIWNVTDGAWMGWSEPTSIPTSTNATVEWNTGGPNADYWTFGNEGDHLVIVYLTGEPQEFSSWVDYDGPVAPFASLSSLEALISSATEGDTIDLEGKHYRPADMTEADSYDLGVAISKDITLSNGTISGTLDTTWTESTTAGIFYTDIPTSTNSNVDYTDPRVYIIDDAQTDAPYLQARRQDSRDEYKPYNGLSKSDIWYNMDGTDGTRTMSGNFATSITADASVKAEWDAYFSGGASGTTTMFLGLPNLVSTVENSSYNSSTGELTFSAPTDLDVVSYMHVIFSGLDPATYLEPGEYCFRASESRIYYRPVNGSAASARVPAMTKLFRTTVAQKTLTLDGCTLYGTMEGNDSSAGAISSAQLGADAGVFATRNGTTMRHCASAISINKIDLQDSNFYEFTRRFASGCQSGQALRNYFGNAANQSIIFFGFSSTADPILVRDNMFNLPASTHGQAVSLYQDSWQNAEVDHNIFYNCQRALSFQPGGGSDGDTSNVGSFEFTNNLYYVDEIRDDPVLSGQTGFAWNAGDAPDLDGLGQVVEIRNNTFVLSQDLYDNSATNNAQQTLRMSFSNSEFLPFFTANNIMPTRIIPTAADYSASTETGHASLNNAQWGTHPINEAFAQSDISSTGFSGVFDLSTLTTTGAWSTAASDGGAVGIRWNSVPAASDLATLGRTWASTYTAATLPTVSYPTNADDIVVAGDDKR